jgi:hypothetical protein
MGNVKAAIGMIMQAPSVSPAQAAQPQAASTGDASAWHPAITTSELEGAQQAKDRGLRRARLREAKGKFAKDATSRKKPQ